MSGKAQSYCKDTWSSWVPGCCTISGLPFKPKMPDWQKASWDWERQLFCHWWGLQCLFGKTATSMEQGISSEEGNLKTWACTAFCTIFKQFGTSGLPPQSGRWPQPCGNSLACCYGCTSIGSRLPLCSSMSYLYCSDTEGAPSCPQTVGEFCLAGCHWRVICSWRSPGLCHGSWWIVWSTWSWWKVLHGKLSLSYCQWFWLFRNH